METIMLSRKKAILDIFNKHGRNSIYIMGLAPCIGLGLALNTSTNVVVISGDASFLMHMGISHTIRDHALNNLFLYILDNNCHESVGGCPCSSLEPHYKGVNDIYKINREGKNDRVKLDPITNKKNLITFLKGNINEK